MTMQNLAAFHPDAEMTIAAFRLGPSTCERSFVGEHVPPTTLAVFS